MCLVDVYRRRSLRSIFSPPGRERRLHPDQSVGHPARRLPELQGEGAALVRAAAAARRAADCKPPSWSSVAVSPSVRANGAGCVFSVPTGRGPTGSGACASSTISWSTAAPPPSSTPATSWARCCSPWVTFDPRCARRPPTASASWRSVAATATASTAQVGRAHTHTHSWLLSKSNDAVRETRRSKDYFSSFLSITVILGKLSGLVQRFS